MVVSVLHVRSLVISVAAGAWFLLDAGVPSATTPDPVAQQAAFTVHPIAIKSRRFDPPVVTLESGRPARLEFRNHDSELHAVVPQQLLTKVNVSVSGNGAPDFGEDGLRRVIIPADGHVELLFTPTQPGTYRYICDMPGHEMEGMIEVRE